MTVDDMTFAEFAAVYTSSEWLHWHLKYWRIDSLAEVLHKLIELQAPVTRDDIAELAALWNDYYIDVHGPDDGTPVTIH